MLIALNRTEIGNYLDINRKLELDDFDNEIIEYISTKITEYFNVNLSKHEQIEYYLMFKTSTTNYTNNQNDYNNIIGDEVICMTKQIISDVKDNYLVSLSSSFFITSFSLHLKNLKDRSLINGYNKNPMLDSIKKHCPLIYDIAVYIAFQLQTNYNFSALTEDEISYLALHIGCEMEREKNEDNKIKCVLLCPDYLNLQKQIYNHLQYYHGSDITIVDIISNPNQIQKYEFSLLITTIEIDRESDYDICFISPLMLSSSLSILNEKIGYIKNKKNKDVFLDTFDLYFSKELFTLNPDVLNKNDAITLLCSLLENHGYIQKNFKDLIHERERMTSTAFNYIAIPHPIKFDAIKTSVAVLVSEKGIDWDGTTVNIVLLPAITDVEKHYISQIYSAILPKLGKIEVIKDLKKIRTFETFKNFLTTSL